MEYAMSDSTDTDRLFSEKEISTILERAADLQQTEDPSRTQGLSLTELQQIAAGAGIDPKHVAAAVAELTISDDNVVNFWGGPATLTITRTIPGEIDAFVQIGDHLYGGT